MTKTKKEKQKKSGSLAGSHETELRELLQRTQASFENYKKQTEKRIQDIHETAARDVILALLPIIDNFELALKNVGSHDQGKEFTQGVELIYSQLTALLEDQGVRVMDTNNVVFDPYFHEALMKIPSEKKENTIIEEFQKGYVMGEVVIRHARVKVSAGRSDTDMENKNTENKQSTEE